MLKATLPLSLVVCLRFLGLFIVLPVIALYAQEFQTNDNALSPAMLGLAVGGAYLTQIIFQTPIGILSDRIDRKKVVMGGLLIFLIGSIICALASNIQTLIVGRLIQGAGAVGGVVSAQITDLVREEQRTSAMAIMGGGIFASFTLAMLLGPLIGGYFGAEWLFWITAFLTFISMILLALKVPNTPKIIYSFSLQEHSLEDNKDNIKTAKEIAKASLIKTILNDKNLMLMNISSFLEKTFMTLIFVVIPLALIENLIPNANIQEQDLWKIYTPAAICAILALAPASILAEKYGKAKLVMVYGILLFLLAYLFIGIGGEYGKFWVFVVGVFLFFLGFASLEPIMQSLTSKYAKAHIRGGALGIFTTWAYAGSFIGGMLGGIMYHWLGILELGLIVAGICLLWLASLVWLNNPTMQKNLYLSLNDYEVKNISKISRKEGIIECYINKSEEIIVLKYDSNILSQEVANAIADSMLAKR